MRTKMLEEMKAALKFLTERDEREKTQLINHVKRLRQTPARDHYIAKIENATMISELFADYIVMWKDYEQREG